MNILFLEDVIEKRMSGVTYYRMLVPGKALDDLGHSVRFSAELLAVDDKGENPKIIVDDLDWADVVVFPRYFNFSPNVVVSVMNYVTSQKKRVIYETDDFLYKIPENNPVAKVVNQPSSQAMINFLESHADEKTVTTRALQEKLGGIICPNSIDMDVWGGIENKNNDSDLVIGWAGGWTHQKDLEMIVPVLSRLKKKYRFIIKFFGYDPNIPKTQLYYKATKFSPSPLEYPTLLAEHGFDIGIAPIIDDEFNQYKSNIKWLEYAMLGVPVVASNLPPYEDITDGVDGFLASTEDEWYEKLEKLITDAVLRREMGQKAKETVIDKYDIKKTIGKWIEAYSGEHSSTNNSKL